MKRFLPLIAAAVIGVAGAGYYMSQNGATTPAVSTTDTTNVDVSAGGDAVTALADRVMGDANAPVTLIEYASYTCPHCANWHEDVFKKLKANYIDTGKVKFVHREVYFDRFGLWAGMIANCSGDMRYFGMVDMIYSGQKEWIGGGDPAMILDSLRKLGRTAGMSDAEMETCLNDEEMAQELVATYQKNAGEDEINATPSFVINGSKYSNMSYAELAETLDKLLVN